MSVLELNDGVERNNGGIRENPQEVAFFRLLHAEVRKAIDFFDKVERECVVREQVVTVGMDILKKPEASMVEDRWSILKKHDKVTGYNTRDPFMVNIVNKANFTNYPKIMELISRCETLYEEASEKLVQDLHEDERLFLNMVSEWNTRNRDAGGAGSSGKDSGAEVTAGLRSDTVRGVSHRSRSEASQLQRRRLPMASSRPLRKRVPYVLGKTEDGQGDDYPKKPRPSK
eukprot:scaffold149_cov179-Amphora_coffeaeformis.AAC.15